MINISLSFFLQKSKIILIYSFINWISFLSYGYDKIYHKYFFLVSKFLFDKYWNKVPSLNKGLIILFIILMK